MGRAVNAQSSTEGVVLSFPSSASTARHISAVEYDSAEADAAACWLLVPILNLLSHPWLPGKLASPAEQVTQFAAINFWAVC